MSASAESIMLQQLAYQAPVLLVYLVGMTLAIVFLKRFRIPSILTLIAIGTLMLASIITTGVQGYLISSRAGAGWSAAQIGQTMSIIGIVGSFVRAAAIGLLLAAVFVGRNSQAAEPLKPPQFGLRALLISVTLFCLVAGLISALVAWTK